MNVESALELITGGTAGKPAASPKPAAKLKDALASEKQPRQLYGESTGKYPNEHLISIEMIPWNAVLTRDIFMPDGQLLMRSGADLTPRVIALLTDLEQLPSPVKEIWVEVRED